MESVEIAFQEKGAKVHILKQYILYKLAFNFDRRETDKEDNLQVYSLKAQKVVLKSQY